MALILPLRAAISAMCRFILYFFIPELKVVAVLDRVLATGAAGSLAGAAGSLWGTSGCSSALLLICTSRLVSIGGCGCEARRAARSSSTLCCLARSSCAWRSTAWQTEQTLRCTDIECNYTQVVEQKRNAYPGEPDPWHNEGISICC